MIGQMEQTAHAAVLPFLEPGQTTVGTLVNIKHLAATPVGMTVRFHAELIEIDRRRLVFKVEAWDEVEKVGEGMHERFIIDAARFIGRLEEKQNHHGTLKGAGDTEYTEKMKKNEKRKSSQE